MFFFLNLKIYASKISKPKMTKSNEVQIDLEKGDHNYVDVDLKVTQASKSKLGSCPIPFPFPCPLGMPCMMPFLSAGLMIIVGIIYLIYRYVFQDNNWNWFNNSFTLDTGVVRMVTKEAHKLMSNKPLSGLDSLALH